MKCVEDSIARIAQPWNNELVFVQTLVNGASMNFDFGAIRL
jgi:hypothetical protein